MIFWINDMFWLWGNQIVNGLRKWFRRFPDRSCESFVTEIFVFGRDFMRFQWAEIFLFCFKIKARSDGKNQSERCRMNYKRQLSVFAIISVFCRMIVMCFEKRNQRHFRVKLFVLPVMFHKSRYLQKLIQLGCRNQE